jgi:hypothetical protein
VLAVFDEIWGFTSERGRRMWDELVPVPSRRISARLIVSHAGFSNESELLFELYNKGSQQPEVAPSLYAGDGQLMFWTFDPISPLQTESWRTDMRRKLRPSQYERMICNRFVRAEAAFIDLTLYDQVVDPLMGHRVADKSLICWAGIDASYKHDSTALALLSWDQINLRVFICDHRIFVPTSDSPINFSIAIEQTILDWHQRFSLQAVWYDPYQMVATAQSLQRQGVVMVDYPQTQALERLGHQRAQLNRVRPVGDDEKFTVAKAVWSRRISRTSERHGKSALAHIIFFHDVLSVLTGAQIVFRLN